MLQLLKHIILLLRSDCIAFKAEAGKLDIKKLVNAQKDFNNFKTKIDSLDIRNLKTVPVGLKKLNNVVDNEVTKNNV